MKRPTRQEAWELLCELNDSERARRHALAVEAVMRYRARRDGESEDEWGIVGLLHDLDYERFPEEHCLKSREILKERGWPSEWIRAIVSHGYGTCSEVRPESRMELTLFAIDELTGLVAAAALVRPSRSLSDLEPKSVKKKWKDKRFAAGVDRALIEKGAEWLSVDVATLIADVIAGMREQAAQLGLDGKGVQTDG